MSGNEKNDSIDGAAAGIAQSLHIWIERAKRNLALDLRVSMPGRVISYDPVTQKAIVRGELLPIKYVGDDELPDIPLLFPPIMVDFTRGMGGLAYSTIPILPDDTGIIHFTDRSLSVWLLTGNPRAPVDPVTGRTHALSDAFFRPGLHTDTDPIEPPTALDAHVIEGPLIRLGVAGVQFAALGTDLIADLLTFAAAVAAANTTWAGNPVTGPAFSTALGAALVTLIAALPLDISTKVQIQ